MGMAGGCRPARHPASHPAFSTTTLPCDGDDVPTPPAYPGVPSQAHVQERPQAGGSTWEAQGGKGEEHRRAWERIGEEERRQGSWEGRTGSQSRGQRGQAGRKEGRRRQWRSCSERGRTFEEGRRGSRGRKGKADGTVGTGAGGTPPTDAIGAAGYPAGAGE